MPYPMIRVRNLGPIREGAVRLHPLTVLIGRNNTGKTYASQAVYSAFKALDQVNGAPEPLLSDEEIERVIAVDRQAIADDDVWRVFGSSVRMKVERWLQDLVRQAGDHLEDRLKVYFDVKGLDELQRWEADSELRVSVFYQAHGENRSLFGLGRGPAAYREHLLSTVVHYPGSKRNGPVLVGAGRYWERSHNYGRGEYARRRISLQLARFAWSEGFLPSVGLGGSAYYLPAGRSGLLEAWTDVVRLRLERERDRLALKGREPAALGGIALDFLSELLPLIQHRRPRQADIFMSTAVERLEGLIAGEIRLGRGRDKVPSFTYAQHGREIPVQRASSMVAEVAPLLGWIKHILRPGDLLLIDEPEAHMHPEAIVAVAETLVALAGAGVRVLCTTHSSEFLHQVSNCMLRSHRTAPKPTASAISPTNLGVYRFSETEEGGTRIVAESIDPDWGIPETEHVAVAERLSRETEELLRTIGR